MTRHPATVGKATVMAGTVLALGLLVTFVATGGTARGAELAKGSAEGSSYDIELWRWVKERKFLEAESSRLRADLEAMEEQEPGDRAEQHRRALKRGRLMQRILETTAAVWGAYGRELDYRLDKKQAAVRSLGNSINGTGKAQEAGHQGIEKIDEEQAKTLDLVLLSGEINAVLGDTVSEAWVYERMAKRSEQVRKGFEKMLDAFGRQDKQWRQDKVRLEAELRQLRLERGLAGLYERIYGQAAQAYRSMVEGAAVDLGGPQGLEPPEPDPMPELPPPFSVITNDGGKGQSSKTREQWEDDYDALQRRLHNYK